jgi:hypothetical protein
MATSHELNAGELVQLGDLHRGPGDALPARELVEPYLAALIQAEHLNLLVGAGLTVGLGYLAQHEGGADMGAELAVPGDEKVQQQLEAAAQSSASEMARGEANLEDRIRVAVTTAQGLENVADDRAEAIRAAIASALGKLRTDVAAVEASIANAARDAVDDETVRGMSLQSLLSTFLGAFAGRAPTRDRAHIFTTNYDRVIEWGAEAAGLRMVDRFVGSLRPTFRSSRLEVDYHYSPPGSVRDPRHLDGVLRLSKLHGSLDWSWDETDRQVVRTPAPFGQASDCDAGNLLIFPNAAKDVETTLYPYADIFRDFAAATCRPHSVLVTYGYSFGDSHINRVIQDMLSIPSTHLLILGFDDTSGRIARFVAEQTRSGQVSLLIGPQLAGIGALVGRWLPWPSADVLLEGRAHVQRQRGIGSDAAPPPVGGEGDQA